MRKPVVLLDCDDVVCRCILGMCKAAEEKIGILYTEEDVKTWDFFSSIEVGQTEFKEYVESRMKEKGWCLSLEPFPDAVEGVARLREVADVYFLTAPYDSEYWEWERRQWLQKHFSIPRDGVVQTSSKYLVRGDFFVDDKVEHLLSWQEYMPSQGKALLWQRPHNAEHAGSSMLEKVSNWDELIRYVK